MSPGGKEKSLVHLRREATESKLKHQVLRKALVYKIFVAVFGRSTLMVLNFGETVGQRTTLKHEV